MNILNNIISFGKSFTKLTQKGQLAVVGALVFLAFTMGNCKGTDKLDSFIVEYQTLKKNAETTIKYADSLKTQVTQLTDSAKKKDEAIQKLTITISFKERQKEQQRVELASLEHRLETAKRDSNPQIIIATQDTVIGNLKTQLNITEQIVTDQKQIITTKDEQLRLTNVALGLATQRGDSLQTILTQMPKTPKNPNKFLGIPLPSRKTTFAVGLLTGVITGIVVMR